MGKATKDSDGLTPKKRRFCLAYLRHMNGSRAVAEAGYTSAYPADLAWKLKREPEIKAFIDKNEAAHLAGLDYSIHAIRKHLLRIATEDLTENPVYRLQCKRLGIDGKTEENINKLLSTMTGEAAVLRNIIKDHKTHQVAALRTLAEIAANSTNQELNERLARLEQIPVKQLASGTTIDSAIEQPDAVEEDAS